MDNLRFLLAEGLSEQMIVRVPLISKYNTQEDVEKSVEKLQKMGVLQIDRFEYLIKF
jgi:pyruvate formate lyase activating enzyme